MPQYTKYEGKKGISWNVRVRRHGKDYASTFPTKKMATEWATKMEHDLIRDAHFLMPDKPIMHTTGELIDLYLERILPHQSPGTQRKQRQRLLWWKSVLGDTHVQNVTTALLEDYKHVLSRQKGYTNGTVNLYLNSLSPCFSWAVSPRLGWIARSPFTDLRRLPTKGRLPLVTNEEIDWLLYWCERSKNRRLHIYVRLILATGARREEVLRATWKQVSFPRKTLTIINTKNKEDRVIPIEPGTLEILREYYEQCAEQDTLLSGISHQKIFPQKTFWGAWRKARERAGLTHLRLHDCRHITASRLAEAGADIALIGEILGHKHISSTMIYRHLTERHTAGILEKMAGNMFQRKQRE